MANLSQEGNKISKWRKVRSILAIVGFLLLVVLSRNCIKNFFHYTSPERFELIRRYIETFLSWPVVVLVIALVFMTRFSIQIGLFIQNIKWWKAFGVEGGQQLQQSSINEVTPSSSPSPSPSPEFTENANEDNSLQWWKERAELFEVGYLSYYLVPNSKYSLLWFYSQPFSIATSDKYYSSYILPFPLGVTNDLMEKQTIIQALLGYGMLQQTSSGLQVTAKGKKFLIHNGLVFDQ